MLKMPAARDVSREVNDILPMASMMGRASNDVMSICSTGVERSCAFVFLRGFLEAVFFDFALAAAMGRASVPKSCGQGEKRQSNTGVKQMTPVGPSIRVDYFKSRTDSMVLPSADNSLGSSAGVSGRDAAGRAAGRTTRSSGRPATGRGATAGASGHTVATTDEWKPLKRVCMAEP